MLASCLGGLLAIGFIIFSKSSHEDDTRSARDPFHRSFLQFELENPQEIPHPVNLFSLRACRSSSEIFLDFLQGNFAALKRKGSNMSGTFRRIFREKSRAAKKKIGQNFYQTYARITGNQGLAQIFWGPFLAFNTGK